MSPSGLRLVATAAGVACLVAGAATVWSGTRWLTSPAPNYVHRNPENLTHLLATFTPLEWTEASGLAAALAVAAALAGSFWISLRRFDDAVRLASVVVIAASLAVPFHSPHWNLWFVFLLCLIPISRALLGLLVVYDLNNLLYWPLFSSSTQIEVLQPLAREVAIYPIAVQCALKFVLIGWLIRGARRGRLSPRGSRASSA